MVAASTDTARAIVLETTAMGRINFCFMVMAHTDTGIRQGIPAGILILTATPHIHQTITTRTQHGAIHRMALELTGRMAIETLSVRTRISMSSIHF